MTLLSVRAAVVLTIAAVVGLVATVLAFPAAALRATCRQHSSSVAPPPREPSPSPTACSRPDPGEDPMMTETFDDDGGHGGRREGAPQVEGAVQEPGSEVAPRGHRPEPLAPQDVADYARFYREAAPRLVGLLVCQGASLAEAADCAQEALITALPPKWSTLDNPLAWCRKVAVRLYLKRKFGSDDTFDELPPDGRPLVAESTDVEAFEQRHTLPALLAQLPPKQRQVFVLTLDGMAPQEIAAVRSAYFSLGRLVDGLANRTLDREEARRLLVETETSIARAHMVVRRIAGESGPLSQRVRAHAERLRELEPVIVWLSDDSDTHSPVELG